MRFSADFEPKISKNFRCRKILRPESREIAPQSALPDGAKPYNEPRRSPNTLPSVNTLHRVRFRAILSGFRTENFENFSRPQNLASEIDRDRAEIRAARRRQASPRATEVPKHCAERRHAAAREIPCDSQRISDRKFRNFFAAAKFMVVSNGAFTPPLHVATATVQRQRCNGKVDEYNISLFIEFFNH